MYEIREYCMSFQGYKHFYYDQLILPCMSSKFIVWSLLIMELRSRSILSPRLKCSFYSILWNYRSLEGGLCFRGHTFIIKLKKNLLMLILFICKIIFMFFFFLSKSSSNCTGCHLNGTGPLNCYKFQSQTS